MRYKQILATVEKNFRQMETSPQVSRALTTMDSSIRFMTQREYQLENPAVAEVRWPLVVGFWVILALVGVTLIWGMLAPIDSAIVAKGNVTLLSSKKTIQHLEGGIIKAIFVKEGDKVVSGQKLLQLEDTMPGANRDALKVQFYTARAGQARLIAEINKKDNIDFGQDLISKGNADPEVAQILATQRHLFDSERQEHSAKIDILNQRVAQHKEEIESLKSRIEGASQQSALLGQEIDMVKGLLKKGYATEPRLLSLQRNQSEATSSKGDYQAQIAKAQQSIAETQISMIDQQKEFETKMLDDLHTAQTQAADLRQKLLSAEDVVSRTVITAPTEGVVTGLKYHTPGGVIAPATPIMDIVPQNDQLILEVHVKPNDISHIRPGLDARIIFTAYKARSTPRVPGKVTQVSADVFENEHAATPAPYYLVRVEADKDFLQKMKNPIEPYPGMPVDVFVRTGSRSFLSYLFRPITDSMSSAFREE